MTDAKSLVRRIQGLARVKLDRFAEHRTPWGIRLYEAVPSNGHHDVYLFGTLELRGRHIVNVGKYSQATVSRGAEAAQPLQPTINDFFDYVRGDSTARALVLAHERATAQRDIHGERFRFLNQGSSRDIFVASKEYTGLMHEDLDVMLVLAYDLGRRRVRSLAAGSVVESRPLQEHDVRFVDSSLREVESWVARSLA